MTHPHTVHVGYLVRSLVKEEDNLVLILSDVVVTFQIFIHHTVDGPYGRRQTE